MKKTLNQIDLAKAYGKHNYHITDLNYREKIINHPIVQGLFTIGNYAVMVGNMKTWQTEYLSGDWIGITEYSESEIKKRGAEFLMNFVVEDAQAFNMEVVKLSIRYLQQRPVSERNKIFLVYFYQAQTKSGRRITIQHQSVPILFDDKMIPYIFTNIFTDVTHLGLTNIPQSTLINRSNGEVFHIQPDNIDLVSQHDLFSNREKQLIQLLIKGYTSKRIANELGISYETARTHRRNILKKANLKNTTQLVGYALTHGLI